jgi:hypothetical protein
MYLVFEKYGDITDLGYIHYYEWINMTSAPPSMGYGQSWYTSTL